MTTNASPTVIYIAGSGRSGSTLLERMIGEIPGYVNVGELIDLAVRVQPDDEYCGCGVPFSECPFWTRVGDRAFGGWSAASLTDLRAQQRSFARQRDIPGVLTARGQQRARLDVYRSTYARLYRAIAEVSGAQVVVDASKRPAQALALAGGHGTAKIDLRICHLTRDVRGVAWSMSRRSGVRPHARGAGERMFRRGTLSAAASWSMCQLEVELLRFRSAPLTRLSYEELMQSPRNSVADLLAALSLTTPGGSLEHLQSGSAKLGSSHGISGNPSRFGAGMTRLRTDEEWRSKMPRAERLAAAALALPARVALAIPLPTSSETQR